MTHTVTVTRDWHIYRALVGAGLVCAIVIVSAYQGTLPAIQRNKAEALQQAIYTIFPDSHHFAKFTLQDSQTFASEAALSTPSVPTTASTQSQSLYAVYNQKDQLTGFAIEAQGPGYQDTLGLLYGYQPATETIVGIQILDSRETPGLGSRIETDVTFLQNFEKLDVASDKDTRRITHPIEAVRPGKKIHAWQIDTISGATISSNAVARILSNSTGFWIPLINLRMEDF